jgi:hypothetical protein
MKAHGKETFLKRNNEIFAECRHGGTRQSISFSKNIENFAKCLPILALGKPAVTIFFLSNDLFLPRVVCGTQQSFAVCPIESSWQRAALLSETLTCALCRGWPLAKRLALGK